MLFVKDVRSFESVICLVFKMWVNFLVFIFYMSRKEFWIVISNLLLYEKVILV